MGVTPTVEQLQSLGQAHGLDAVGVARAEVFAGTLDDLRERKEAGLHATMAFTYRNPERSTDPHRTLPEARSLVVAARSYLRDGTAAAPVDGPPGAVARYVWEDHYAALRSGLDVLAEALRDAGHATRVLVDDNALVDREAAYRAGLGWYGKNANLLLPGRGSWFVLGSVLTSADLDAATPLDDGCGSCTRCLTSCPTDAIVAPGVIDANRCLAWLVQAEGTFPMEHRTALGGRIYGCDDCQEVCPPNRREARQPVVITNAAQRPEVPLLALLELDDEALLEQYGRWYIARRDPRHLRRNALVALGNVADGSEPGVERALRHWLAEDDDLVRGHAVWCAKRLGRSDLLHLVGRHPSPAVAAELAADVPPRRTNGTMVD